MLKITDLVLGYQGNAVLRLGKLELDQGEQCLITGPSGSGKTTLLYAIAGLIDVMKGNIVIDGNDIAAMPEESRDRVRGGNIGVIFQTLHLIKSLSVIDNLCLAAYVAGQSQKRGRMEEMLGRLGLADKKNVMPETLSQGQAQRVAIARAMTNAPKLILADEPTSALDDDACKAVIELIRKIANENNATLVISTHDSRIKPFFNRKINLGDMK